MVKYFSSLLFLLMVVHGLVGETLWNPDFKGYIGTSPVVAAGDVILVEINLGSSLSFSASRQDSRQITLEFTGGETGNLFSFLPDIRSGDTLSGKGKDSYSLKTVMAARVMNTDNNGKALIKGTRSMMIDGRVESITLSGWIDPGNLGKGNKIPFSRIADSKMVYTTVLEANKGTLTDKDIREIITKSAGAPGTQSGGTVPANTKGAPAAGGAAGTNTPGSTSAANSAASGKKYRITDAKKRELLLFYINRMIGLIF
ncbi:MAG: flagellar basal body L-ring protein FlgH [Spirochaetes bacterium]|nr:flagellar basal body L-ring protein FlgH [Spirochaetota bacterium]